MSYEERLDDAREEGIAIGFQQGIEQGAQAKAIETAKNLFSKGVSAIVISECTGLSLSEVEKLK